MTTDIEVSAVEAPAEEPPREFVLVTTGERLPATRENAVAVVVAARERKRALDDIIRDAEAFLAEESMRQGTKTFQTDTGKVTLSGGPRTDYDPEVLAAELRAAGCPEARVDEVVHTRPIEYVVDKRILKQLTGANPAYAAAAEKAAIRVEEPVRASVKTPTTRRTT